MKKIIPLILLAILMVAMPNVLAHGFIDRTNPTDGATLQTAPEQLEIWFSEPIVPDSARVTLVDGNSQSIALGAVQYADDDPAYIVVDLPQTLADGAYILSARGRVVSDGHEVTGSVVFWVGERTATAAASSANTPDYELILFFTSIMVIVGAVGYWYTHHLESELPLEPDADETAFPLK